MASRGSRRSPSKSRVNTNKTVASSYKSSYNKSERDTVLLRSLLNAHIKYVGPVSGLKFEWPHAGSVVAVPKGDADVFLAKRIGGKTCCGASPTSNRIFEVVPT